LCPAEEVIAVIELSFIVIAICAVVATGSIVPAVNYWLAKQHARDRKEAEVRERGFE
jgi:hypothetical protein